MRRLAPTLALLGLAACGPASPAHSSESGGEVSESETGQAETGESETGELDPCALDSLLVSASVTLDGTTHTFTSGEGIFHIVVDEDEGETIDFVTFRAENGELNLGVQLGTATVQGLDLPIFEEFGPTRLYLSEGEWGEGYFVAEEDLEDVDSDYEILAHDPGCATFSFSTAEVEAVFLPDRGSGTHVLTDIEVTVSGPFSREELPAP